MPGNDVSFYLRKAMGGKPIVVSGGASSYFSAPEQHLDPSLFEGDRLKGTVRAHLINILFGYLTTHWTQPHAWARAWLAGSGITYQWSADRGNGDLDVLLGADWSTLRRHNPRYEGLSNAEIATDINDRLRTELWPRTATTRFGQRVYEVTFYLNQNSTDIRTIHPYAAYDLISDTWTVRPPALSADHRYPREWKRQIDSEAAIARDIIDRLNHAQQAADLAVLGGGAWTNAMAVARLAADQATALYDDIHLGRRQAFGEFGEGYGDYANYRWQAHKRNGIVNALAQITKIHKQAREDAEKALYGQVLPDPDHSRLSALLYGKGPR